MLPNIYQNAGAIKIEDPNAVKTYAKRLAALESEFETWKSHFKEISEYLIPRKGRFIDRDTIQNDGKKRHRAIIDNTAGRALHQLAAGMQSGLTSPARPWFKLGLPNKDLEDYPPVKIWLEDVRRMMLHIFQKSNFYTAVHNIYYELGAFGTGVMNIDSDYDRVIRCYPFTVGEYYLSCGPNYTVDTLYRNYWMTAKNMCMRFGNRVSKSVKNMYQNGNGEQWVRVIHVIEPNTQADPGKMLSKFKPYKSVLFEHSNHNDQFLFESGYDMFPVMAPRWGVTGTDVYGISPGMETLGDIKMLQKMQKKSLRALDKIVDPPMNAPLTLKSKGTTTIPGGVNYIDTVSNTQTFTPAYQINPDIQAIEYKIEKVQQAIREGFFADLFAMVSSADKRMTATEVVERHEEKLLMLGPVIERIQPELLDLVIDRTFSIMASAAPSLIPPPPIELQGMELEVEYISLLAQAQKMVGVTAIEQVAAFVGNLAAVKPETIDKFDQDEAVNQYADMVGVPPKIITSNEDAQEIREQRAQQIQQQQMMEQLTQAAQGAKTLSETDTGGNNALAALMGQAQQPQAR